MNRTERIRRLALLQHQYGIEPASLYMACRIMDRYESAEIPNQRSSVTEFLVIADACYGNVARYRLRFDRSVLWAILDRTNFYLPLDGFFSVLGRYTYQCRQNTPLWTNVTTKICLHAINEDPTTIILALVLLQRKGRLFPPELVKEARFARFVQMVRVISRRTKIKPGLMLRKLTC